MTNQFAFVSSSNIGIAAGYIYLVYSEEPVAAYIGQTRGHLGALGRLSQHLSERDSNTFLQRVAQRYRLTDVKVSKIHFIAYKLPEEKRFNERYADYREAVEGATSKLLLNRFSDNKLLVPIISNFSLNGYSSQSDIIEIAKIISNEFCNNILSIIPNLGVSKSSDAYSFNKK
jgi:hypothetical protein